MNRLKMIGIVGATLAACAFGAVIGTTGVIMWSAYDVWRKHG